MKLRGKAIVRKEGGKRPVGGIHSKDLLPLKDKKVDWLVKESDEE